MYERENRLKTISNLNHAVYTAHPKSSLLEMNIQHGSESENDESSFYLSYFKEQENEPRKLSEWKYIHDHCIFASF